MTSAIRRCCWRSISSRTPGGDLHRGRASGQAGKGWLNFDGVVTLILGVMIFTGFPLSGLIAIGVLLGVKLLLAGMTMLTLGTAAGRVVPQGGQG
jgi:hypothetical protein